ncbi:MAG: ABC transporter substrate-binding protein [Clostridia bacterium]|nr:ABC transporter substrate-binding protein [Clostridia bacterium]
MRTKSIKRILAILLSLVMVLALAACGGSTKTDENSAGTTKFLNLGTSFAYPSLDTHKEYYGWYTSIYGITESLFKIGDDLSIQPCLAEKAEANGNEWIITLKDGIKFSNGNPVTSQIVIKNLQRLASLNERFSYFGEYTYKYVDDKTFSIFCPEVYPILPNDLASPEFGILDIDNIADFDKGIIGTGPFVIKEFIPEGDVTLEKNTNYWGGEVKLDGVKFFYMQEDEPKLMAMQSGEIQGYDSVTADAYEIFKKDPSKYSLTDISGTRLQFYFLNKTRLSDNVRKAINGTVDKQAIADYLKGTTSATDGPFNSSAAYGKSTGVQKLDAAAAKALLEQDGYTMGANGIYEKDGKPLQINICYYAARSLDTLATLIQSQLKAIGIDSKLTVEEDPDATYIASKDFDLALYCMISDKSGDPYYFIDSCLRQGAYYDITGFKNDECEALINQLEHETDVAKRAELANKIIQYSIDDGVIGYVGLFNKITVLQPGITGYANNNPFDFYAVSADTDITA